MRTKTENMIYTVKRFSQITQQKEFGWIRNRLQKTIIKEKGFKNKFEEKFKKRDKLLNSDVENKIIDDHKNIADVTSKFIYDGINHDSSSCKDASKSLKDLKKVVKESNGELTYDMKLILELLDKYKKNKISDIFWDRSDGLEQLVHEFGHIKNYRGNFLDRFVHKGADFGEKFQNSSSGAINAFLDVIGGKFINWEEKNASKKGYELLKKYNLSPQDIKLAKEMMDNALEYYKSKNRISWRQKLVNSKLPSWLL